jgi:proline iminopeptidase
MTATATAMTVAVAGAQLFCTARGRGPTCLVLCNLGTRVYQRQLPAALDDHLRLVFVDLRGSGRSTGDVADLTFDRLADDLDAVLSALGIEGTGTAGAVTVAGGVALFGHSILGMLAIEVARRRPSVISHVVAVGTPPFGDMPRLMARSRAFFDADASGERKDILRENMGRLPPGAPPGQAVLAQTPMRFFDPRFDAAALFAEAEVHVRPEVLTHILGTLAPPWDVARGGAALRAPLLLAHGRHDYTVPHTLWDDVLPSPSLPGARLCLFERSGHQPFVEEPDRFAALVAAFVAGG